jgi:hypothetical protein
MSFLFFLQAFMLVPLSSGDFRLHASPGLVHPFSFSMLILWSVCPIENSMLTSLLATGVVEKSGIDGKESEVRVKDRVTGPSLG